MGEAVDRRMTFRCHRRACGSSLGLLAAPLPAGSELRLGVAGRVSEPDGFWGDADPSNLDTVGGELDFSVESVSLPLSGLGFAASASPAAPLDWDASPPTGCGLRFEFA